MVCVPTVVSSVGATVTSLRSMSTAPLPVMPSTARPVVSNLLHSLALPEGEPRARALSTKLSRRES